MKTEKIIELYRPCAEGAKYLRKYKNLKIAWKHCQRGDWMLWLAQKIGVATPVLTLAKGLCANTVRHLMKDPRSIAAVDAALSFGRGEITEKKLADAYAYVAAAADAAAADAYGDAAAADAANAAAYAAYAAANAAAYAAYAAYAADGDADAAAYVAAAAAAYVAADAAAYVAAAADAAAYVAAAADAAAAAADAAKKANQQQTADICREILTKAVMEAAGRGE